MKDQKSAKSKKTLALAVTAILIAGVAGLVGVLGITKAYAQESLDSYPILIQNLAEKFNLDSEEVFEVFEDTREQRVNERLDAFVEDGTITEEQKELIIEKQEDFRSQFEDIHNQQLTSEERRNAMFELKEEMRDWAEENDIPLLQIMMRGKQDGLRDKGFGHRGQMRDF